MTTRYTEEQTATAIEYADGSEAVGVTGKEIAIELGMTTREANKMMRELAKAGKLLETKWVRKGGEWAERTENKKVPAASIVWMHPNHRHFGGIIDQ